MTTYHIKGHKTAEYDLSSSGDTYVLDKGASIIVDGDVALYQQFMVHDNHLVIKGTVTGGDDYLQAGILMAGPDSDIVVGQTGLVKGYTGVDLAGVNTNIRNEGRIIGDGYGILAHHNNSIDNAGVIRATFGISTYNDDVHVLNEAGARIVSVGAAIVLAGTASTHSRVVNHGLLEGTEAAVKSLASNDTVINRGVMKGDIQLGEGDDVFDNRGGSVDHNIVGGAGNDTLFADKAATHLVEKSGEGLDTVKATVSYTLSANVENLVLLGKHDLDGIGNGADNKIDGTTGDNKLVGKAGMDTLNGFAGDDTLSGGTGGDVFLFAMGSGHDVVTDFKSGEDHIDLSGLDAIADFDDLKAHHLTVSGDNLIIHAGGDTLTLENVGKADLAFEDFFF